MEKALDTRFRTLLSKLHRACLKPAGFKKAGNNFRVYLPDGLCKIINFQRSLYNGGDECRFTMNIGIYFEKDRENPDLRFREYACAIRARVFQVSRRYTSDQWWEITENSDDEKLYEELAVVISEEVLPWLEGFSSLEATVRMAQAGELRRFLWKNLN